MTDAPGNPTPPACADGVCADDVPPLIGEHLTGTDLTLDEAAARALDGAPLPDGLTDLQRRLVHERALGL